MTKINSYKDLDVYQRSYKAAIKLIGELLPQLPQEEKFDLQDQLRRSSKAVPRLIAEGFAKKHYKRSFQKYLSDAMAENNETIVGLKQSIDLYPHSIDKDLCRKIIAEYDIIGRQLNKLLQSWNKIYFPQKVW